MSRRSLAPAALALLVSLLVLPAPARAAFGFRPGSEGFEAAPVTEGGAPVTQAGAHPYALEADAAFNTAAGASDGDLRELTVHLPPGLLVNPTSVAECTAAAFHTHRTSPYEVSQSGEDCPDNTQVGVLAVDVGGTVRHFGLFNLVSSFGSLATLGASPFGTPLRFEVRLRESDYGLDLDLAEVPQSLDLQSLRLTIWGTPWQPVHNGRRGDCLNEQSAGSWGECLVFGAAPAPAEQIHSYVTLPTTPCGSPLAFTAAARSWQGGESAASDEAPALTNCNAALTIGTLQLMTADAAQRTGLAFNLAVNDGGGILNPGGIARPAIRNAVASLPDGLTVNPSLAAGLSACSEAQFAAETALSEFGAGCPASSKIGTVVLEGTLGLGEPLVGSVFLAQPYANRFGSLIAVYMVAKLPRRGLVVKSVGRLDPDPRSGRLLARFEELPRLLYTHFNLILREGQRSALLSPPLCGAYRADLELASWAQPDLFEHDSSTFYITHGEGGGPCPGGVPPFAPGLIAGSINPQAGAYTPFYLRMTRTDSEQEITSYSATLPPGLLGKLAGVGDCPDAALDAAKGISGAEELAHPSCPDSSRIGRTMAGFGVGGTLAWAPGGLFLAGPYHGAPLSVVAIDSALIGPFDLGTVVVRQAIRIDPTSARVSLDAAGSDPIPHILGGIPLHLRDIRVYVDRPGFTVNPTSCDRMQVSSSLGGSGADPYSAADDSTAGSSRRYQLLNCSVLDFRPRLRLRLTGGTRRGRFPSLRATYEPRSGDANITTAAVALPRSEFLAQSHLRDVCARALFAASACPPRSVYGRARAFTPLLEAPLEGDVYLRSGNPLPDLAVDLRGRGGIRIELAGRIDAVHGGLRATFTGLPDAPVSKFTLTLAGGRRGLLENERDLCAGTRFAQVRMIGHNNLGSAFRAPVRAKCPGRHGGKGKRGA